MVDAKYSLEESCAVRSDNIIPVNSEWVRDMGETGIIAIIAVGTAAIGVVAVYMNEMYRRRELMNRGKGKK